MYFEEFEVGQHFELEPITLTEKEIFDFAEKFDPQPIHIDEEFSKNSIFNGIIASGLHTMSAVWGQWIRANKFGTEIIGGIGLDYMNWKAPVRPNDKLKTVVEVANKIPSSRGNRGIVVIKFTVTNQSEEIVLETQARVIVKRRKSTG
jgi:acyl dehydratase